MRFLRLQKITFQPFDEYVEASNSYPTNASQCLPNWYKALPRYVNNSDKPIKAMGMKDVKMCVPFRDAMISGYQIVLPADVEVRITSDGDVNTFWNPQLPVKLVEKRGPLTQTNQGYGMPHPLGTSPIMFAWCAFYGIKTDKKYSVLVTHPFNRHDLPFVTTTGIIDSGFFSLAGNIPFFMKEGFEGVIEKGTPIAQVLPFRRESWVSEKLASDRRSYELFMTWRDSFLEGFYSRFMRQEKRYK